MTPKIIGLDLSLRATGIACQDGTEVTSDVITAGKKIGLSRMHEIVSEISKRIEVPRTVFMIEDFSFGSKGASLFEIAGLGYLVRSRLWELDVPFYLITPTQVKKFCTGKGTAEKSIVIREVFRRFGHIANDDNEADAVVLHYIGRALFGSFMPTAAFQGEVLNAIKDRYVGCFA